MPKPQGSMQERVLKAAKNVLARDKCIGPIQLLEQLGFLHYSHIKQWKQGNPHFSSLEPHIQCGEKKLKQAYQVFFEWVQQQKLEPFDATFNAATRGGAKPLQVSADGDPEKETFFRTHFRGTDLTDAQKQRIEKKQTKAPDLLVYIVTSKSSECSECSAPLETGNLIFLEQQEALCLTCVDMDHLEFLPSGNATLTRRARKHSPLSAIVMRFNRSRKRYQRQGVLVTSQAIDDAEAQNKGDADTRAKNREKAAVRRQVDDKKLVEEMTQLIFVQFPGCSPAEARAIATHTAQRGSGRVGRSEAGRNLDEVAIKLAVIARIRHHYTDYDEMLMQGVERQEARRQIAGRVAEVLTQWQG